MWFKKALFFTLALVLGACIVIPRTKVAQEMVRARLLPWYEQSFGCSVTCDKFSFSLVFPSIELSGATIKSLDESQPWQCDCKQITFSASWFGIIMRRIFNLSITLDHPVITSGAQGQSLYFIEDHVKRYFSGPPSLPIALKELMLRHVDLRVTDQKNALELRTLFSCDYKKMLTGYGFNIHGEDAALQYGSYALVRDGKGYWQSSLEYAAGATIVTGHGRGEVTLFQEGHSELCYWEAKAVQGAITFTLWRSESEDMCTIKMDDQSLDATLTLTLQRIAEHCAPPAYAGMVKGSLKATYSASRAQGLDKGQVTVAINDGAYGQHELFKEALFSVPARSDATYHGDLAFTLTDKETVSGTWSWEPQLKHGEAHLINAAGIELGSFSLKPDATRKGGYVAKTLLHVPNDEANKEAMLLVKAEARYAQGALSLHAERGQEQFFLEGVLGKTFDVSLLRWIDGNQKTLIDLSYGSADNHRINGVVDVGAVQRLAKRVWGVDVHGEGAVEVRGHYVNKRYELALEGSKLAVRLPRIYNVINGLTGTFIFDPQASSLDLSQVRCTLHRGAFFIPHAMIKYDPAEEVVVFDVPLSLTSFWFNVEKDLYALLSGELTLKRTGATVPLLSGELIVEHAHVSESLLKLPVLQKANPQSVLDKAQRYPLGLNVLVRSKNPIQVMLARLEGSANIAMQIGNTLAEPTLSGVIRLDDGKVVFPYKPLLVRKAQFTFVPQQSYDPTIELFAKNRIKGYDVSLTIQGSLSSHDMRLQSTPSLSDEQLVSLLYAGSEQGALGALVPSMVMQNISSIFSKNGSDATKSGVDKNSWRERLKRIRVVPSIVPSFIDHRGRGGIRGTIEIDIDDRWRALLQKNFPLSEDTRFELNYDVSDDLSVRGVRDERRDLGAEVEMKMKF